MEKFKKELIESLTKELHKFFGEKKEKEISSSTKDDQSIVTEIDLFVSQFIKEKLENHSLYKNYQFLSEEDLADLQFPCAIIDPIDGTRELSKGRAECAVSIALMNSHLIDDPKNYAWVYNPFSGFSIDSNDQYVRVKNKSLQKISGMVSRSELHKGLFDDLKNPLIQVIPRGSIAFKLGLLASGACDFIVSKNPKNIWDIAAGTILCQKRGYSFYVDGKKIEGLDLERYNGVLIWAQESQIAEIYQEFKNEK